ISVEDVVNYPKAYGFTFTNGIVKKDFQGITRKNGSTSKYSVGSGSYYYVAPLVAEKWDNSKEILVWVGCTEISSRKTLWDKPLRAGLRMEETKLDKYYQLAIKNSEENHGIKLAGSDP
ncbi:MAG: hypothetical protein ABSE95_15860, partial [Thermodesulfobacteriota bacterium]